MQADKMFGEELKEMRSRKRLTLREFCRKAFEDPANLSRIERGLRPAPNDEVVERYAKVLSIEPESATWIRFFDLAAISRRELPRDIVSNEELAAKLPAMLRTLRGEKPTEKELETAINVTKAVFRP